MSKQKSISEQIYDLQKENESVKALKHHFNAAVRSEFGHDVKELHQIITKCELLERKETAKQQSSFTSSQPNTNGYM